MSDDELQRQENLERILHSPSYRPAYKDVDFLDGPRLRPQRMELIPIILFGREFWERAVDFRYLADEGTIDDEHLDLFRYAETAEEAWEMIRRFHGDSFDRA